jgi:Uncharacterised nucleotidyltransferase
LRREIGADRVCTPGPTRGAAILPAMEHPALGEFRERVRGVRGRDEIVRCLVLKGPALAQLLYTRDEHRTYSDVDLLISPEDLPRAREALVELGCTGGGEKSGIDDVAGILHSELWVLWTEGGRPVPVDLHWRLAGCEAPPADAWRELRARRTWIELAGRRVPVLDHVGLALHLATHAAQHGPLALKTIGDLERGIERWSLEVWRSAARLAREVQGTPAFAAGLRLIPSGAALAGELDLPPTDELSWRILHHDARPRGTFHVQAWAQARGIRERANLLRRSLIPKPEWIGWEYQWARRSRVLLVVAYVMHVLRAPVWAARAWRFRRRAWRAGR